MKTLALLIILPFLHIDIPVNHITTNSIIKKDAKKLAEYYRQRALRGESVASLAKLYSEDPGSASNGGQYDNITKGMFVPAFEKVAYRHFFEFLRVLPLAFAPGRQNPQSTKPFGFSSVLTHMSSEPD